MKDSVLSKLRVELFGDVQVLTVEQVRQLMKEHSKAVGSGRKAAADAGVNTTYWSCASSGKQKVGKKIARAYHLEPVLMFRVVED